LAQQFGDRLQRANQPPTPGRAPSETDGWPDIEHPLCIHGRAVLERFPWVRDHPHTRFITFLREPLAGAISLWRSQTRFVPWNAANHQSAPADVADFLLNQYNHNRYRKWIERSGRSLEEYFFVGLVERFDVSMITLFSLCG
jgi:hypothetical protein